VGVGVIESKGCDTAISYATAAGTGNNSTSTSTPVTHAVSTKKTNKKNSNNTTTTNAATNNTIANNPYGVQVGDGGLVKGVLAHVKGLLA